MVGFVGFGWVWLVHLRKTVTGSLRRTRVERARAARERRRARRSRACTASSQGGRSHSLGS